MSRATNPVRWRILRVGETTKATDEFLERHTGKSIWRTCGGVGVVNENGRGHFRRRVASKRAGVTMEPVKMWALLDKRGRIIGGDVRKDKADLVFRYCGHLSEPGLSQELAEKGRAFVRVLVSPAQEVARRA